MKFNFLIIAIMVFTITTKAQQTESFKDLRDGKTYKIVKIGTQTWMAENLTYKSSNKCLCYPDETSQPSFSATNDSSKYCHLYGRLYDWKDAIQASSSSNSLSIVQGVCPAGWHLPSFDEWETLIAYLGGESVAGGKLKDTIYWDSPNTGATNSSGFSALPGGLGNLFHECSLIGQHGGWWSSTESIARGGSSRRVWSIYVCSDFNDVSSFTYNKDDKLSVRCLRDK